MKISELIESLRRCDPGLEVAVEIKRARALGDGEFRALSSKERKRVTSRQGKPCLLEPLTLPGSTEPAPIGAPEPTLNERLARALLPAD